MKITNSLIFIPENSLSVKKTMMIEKYGYINPLLRNINKKNKEPSGQRSLNNPEQKIEKPAQTKKSGSGKIYIKNAIGGPIFINIQDGHDEAGYPKYREIKIIDYIRKEKISIKDLDSQEIQSLYDGGKIIDITEDQYSEEMSNKSINDNSKSKSSKKELHDLRSVREQDKKIEINGREITITEDLYQNERSVTEEMEVNERTRLGKETELLMRGGVALNEEIDELIPGEKSYTGKRQAPPRGSGERRSESSFSRPVVMSDPEKAIRRK